MSGRVLTYCYPQYFQTDLVAHFHNRYIHIPFWKTENLLEEVIGEKNPELIVGGTVEDLRISYQFRILHAKGLGMVVQILSEGGFETYNLFVMRD